MQIKETARAKINLALHVTGQRDDGYHLLDSVVAFADFGDVLTFQKSTEFKLDVNGPFGNAMGDPKDNLIFKAAERLGHTDVAIALDKHIPVAAGVGGGSADAAASLRGLSRLFETDISADDALALGADVPVCLMQRACVMRGIGDEILAIDAMPDLPILLVNPRVAVPTHTVFSMLASKENAHLSPLPKSGDFDVWIRYLSKQRNDLEEPAMAFAPVIGEVLGALRDARLARMSGSGATCFGIFDTVEACQDAAAALRTKHPNWWVMPSILRGG
ncbi:MAG: 4-(cytidine 5'-diphospho)-2-C-methyl-D-erythritol kinase [Pseudomonadota bacterium]